MLLKFLEDTLYIYIYIDIYKCNVRVKWSGKYTFHRTKRGCEVVYDTSAIRKGRSEGVHTGAGDLYGRDPDPRMPRGNVVQVVLHALHGLASSGKTA